jgi:bifunctional non-homologous end joining protein LigD
MADALAPYRQKRNFGITPEPRGATAKRGEALSFVIQKHAARSLHYDFRLELDGTLKSWAVPKGPSLDPSQKRMAVHVEDHPLAYGSFEGTIPANQYGAGDVIVWDRGTWHPEGDPSAGYRAGKLKFRLDGEKLKGTWMLIRMHGRESDRQEPWLLIKERDATARPAAEYSVVDALPNSVLSQRAVVEAPKGKARSTSESNPSAAQAGSKSATATATATATAKGAKAAAGSKGEAAKAKSTTTRAASKTAAKPARKRSRDASSTATTDDTARPAPTKAGAARTKAKPPPTAPSLPAGAVRSALPATLEPELATLVKEVPANGDWSYEIKFDGYRVLARIENGEVRLLTRNGNDWTAKLRGIADAIGRLGLDATWLDGEIVVLGAHGASDFAALQNAFDGGGATIRYFVFDLPFHAGHDLRRVPLGERRALLGALLADADGVVRFSQDFESDPDEILRNACRLHLEGVIGKRIDSAYVGGRTRDWIKLKCTLRQEFVIAGYTEPQGSRTGLGALLLGIHDERGRLRYAGNVGTGFDVKTLGALRKELSKLETAQAPFADKARTGRATWVEPKLVAEISFSEWTRDGKVRHAVFHGLRSDKPPQAITREVAAPTPGGKLPEQPATPNDAAPAEPAPASKPARPASARARPAATAASKAQADPPPTPALPASVRVTHPDRVIDPKSGHTKRDLVDYYLHAARRIQPHLQGRPVALVRAPAGVEGHHFFQKHSGSLHIDDLVELPEALDPGHPPLIEIDSFTALISAAQMNVVEFHTWNAMSRAIEKPDRMTFDLDPGEGVGWAAMVEAARLTRSLLDAIGLVAFVKTSGGKGLHVVVPLAPREGWDDVKDFSREVVERLAELAPDKLVAKSGPKNRVGRIFVDYLRNGRGATTAAAYSARARAGLGVSVPCDWDELDALRGGDHWTIANAHERLEAAADPWADYASCRQALGAARKALRRGVAA